MTTIRITVDVAEQELADLLTVLADWSIEHSGKDRDDDDIPRPELDGASPREIRIGELYQRFGAFLPDVMAEAERIRSAPDFAANAAAACRRANETGKHDPDARFFDHLLGELLRELDDDWASRREP